MQTGDFVNIEEDSNSLPDPEAGPVQNLMENIEPRLELTTPDLASIGPSNAAEILPGPSGAIRLVPSEWA